MRVVKEPEERKQEIIDAAIRVFARKGYEKTSISDIAKEIGISQGLCYRYFPSKEMIYDAAIDEYAEYIVNTNLKSYHYADRPLKEQMELMSGNMDAYSSAEKGKTEFYELFHKEGNRKMHNELFLRTGEKLVPFITEVLKKAKERGEITCDNPESMAYFYVYGQIGILMRHDIDEAEKIRQIHKCAIEMFDL